MVELIIAHSSLDRVALRELSIVPSLVLYRGFRIYVPVQRAWLEPKHRSGPCQALTSRIHICLVYLLDTTSDMELHVPAPMRS
jgi:hypothetical protein